MKTAVRNFGLLLAVITLSNAVAQDYQIGVSIQTFNDPARNRNIPAAIYYPANEAGTNVAVASSSVGFPVVSFGHGFVIDTDSYSWLWEALVPKGYIVVLPRTEGQLLPAPSHPNFGRDIDFCAAEIIRLGTVPSSPFSGKVLPRAAFMGHSMGGGATYLGAANSAVVTTTITFAAAETNPSSIAAAAQVSVPSLVIAAVEDCVTPVGTNQEPMYNNLPSERKAIVRIEGASHCNFTNGSAGFCYLGEGFTCGGFGPFTSREEQHARTLLVLEPWLERFLKSECTAGEEIQEVLNLGAAEGKWTFELGDAQSFDCPELCAAPHALSAAGSPAQGFALSWNEVDAALGYRYQARVQGGGPSIAGLSAVPSFQTAPVPSNLNYEFRVRAFCPGLGFGAWSPWTALTHQLNMEAQVLWNGNDLMLEMSSNAQDQVEYQVVILPLGFGNLSTPQALNLRANGGMASTSISHLPAGLYVAHISAQGGAPLKLKFLKQ